MERQGECKYHRFYKAGFRDLTTGYIDWERDLFRVILIYYRNDIFNPEDNLYEDIACFEVKARGYATGGQILKNKNTIFTYNKKILAADNSVWHGSIAATGAAIYYGDKVKVLISFIYFNHMEYCEDGKFELRWKNGNIYKIPYR